MFTCSHCHKEITDSPVGTKQRNHCPYCLWSLHLDEELPGDRKSDCHGLMQPIGLTTKNTSDKKLALHATGVYPAVSGAIGSHLPQNEIGELMIVHQCIKCSKFSKNRIAGDDDPSQLLGLLSFTDSLSPWTLLSVDNVDEVKTQLFGN